MSGQPFPYFDDVDIGPALAKGTWVVLLVQPGCEACERELARSERETRRLRLPLAVLQLPSGVRGGIHSSTGRIVGSLKARKRWVARTPLTFRLDDGVVSPLH
jgi:hypothetical protein